MHPSKLGSPTSGLLHVCMYKHGWQLLTLAMVSSGHQAEERKRQPCGRSTMAEPLACMENLLHPSPFAVAATLAIPDSGLLLMIRNDACA